MFTHPSTAALISGIRHRSPGLVQALAMVACAAGIGLWGALLLAPLPLPAPAALASGPVTGPNLAPVINWFGGNSARLRIEVVGLIASGQQGAALLSINGEPPKAYRTGQTLAQGVSLSAVLPQGVAIDQDGITETITIAAPQPAQPGFIAVPPATTGR
ncbi:MAG: type II secretion system protein N [Pusillimonas sp.]